MKEAFAVSAAILAVVGNVPYVIDVLKGKVRPHAYTWFIWSLVSFIVFFGQVQAGAGIGALPTFAAEIFTLIIFFLSLKFGFTGITRTDTYFLIAALLAFVPWLLSRDPTISVIMAVSIDAIAFIPTLRKTWKHPETEQPILYGSNVLRHLLALASLQTYNIATTLHSFSMILINSVMTVLILKGRHSSKGVNRRKNPSV